MEVRGESFILHLPQEWDVFVVCDNVKGSAGEDDVFRLSGNSAHAFARRHNVDFARSLRELERLSLETMRESLVDARLTSTNTIELILEDGSRLHGTQSEVGHGEGFFDQWCLVGPAAVLFLTHEGPTKAQACRDELLLAFRHAQWRQQPPRSKGA